MLPWLQPSESVHVWIESARERSRCLEGGSGGVVSALWLGCLSEGVCEGVCVSAEGGGH